MEKHSIVGKPKMLAKKLTIYIVLGLLLVFLLLITAIATITRNDLMEREQEKLSMLASENASIAREFMETMLSKQEVLTNTVKNTRNVDQAQKIEIIKGIISDTNAQESNILSLFLVAEPNIVGPNTPNGYSIFATDKGVSAAPNMFENINQELYLETKKSKKMAIVDPFVKTIDGKEYTVITVLRPILDQNNEVTGMVGSNIDINLLNSASYNDGGYESFGTQIICGHQTVIINDMTPESIGEKFVDVSQSSMTQTILNSAKDATTLNILDTNTDGKQYYKAYIPFLIRGFDVVWLSGTSIAKAEFDATIINQVVVLVLISMIGLSCLATFAYFTIRRALRPLRELDHAAREISKGNLHVEIAFHSNDELGALAESLRNSIQILYSYVSDIDHAMAEMAKGNFDISASQKFVGDFQNIEKSINSFVYTMTHALLQINKASEQVSSSSDQVSIGSQALSQGATEQASSVERLASTVADISDQVNANAKNAKQANLKVEAVSHEILESNAHMTEMTHAIAEISRQSTEINKVIKTIEDIAFQTNILALNAAVEAARAGASGKGFAVVADEVRNLASKSAEAAKGTTALIEGSIRAVADGAKIADSTALSMLRVVESARAVADVISRITLASEEQAEAVTFVTSTIEQISDVVQTNSSTAEESAAASEELSGQAQILKDLALRFHLRDDLDIE